MSRPAIRLRAAHVIRPHGVRGGVRVEMLGGDASRFTVGLCLEEERTGRTLTVRGARGLPDGHVLLDLEEVTTREAAEQLRGAYLCVGREQVRRLGDDEWLVADLVGLRAVDADGAVLGTVSDVETYPEQDVLVVDDGGGQRRFPLVRAFVHRVDVDAGVVVLTPWEEEA